MKDNEARVWHEGRDGVRKGIISQMHQVGDCLIEHQ